MTEFDKTDGVIFYDVAHLFKHPKVIDEAIKDDLILHVNET